ncbi:MAG: multidrug effflux MFS transporter [Rhizobiaceae bacterium]|nr:multidrug effflux MFS transporter [Rhizobiaceae bacterium]
MSSRSFLNPRTPPHIVTLVLISGLSALTMNIFLPSLPSISIHFNEDKTVVQLAITLYLIAIAIMQPVLGPFSDYYGRRPVVLFGMFGFFVGTFITIYAPTIEVLLAGRMIQALCATGLVVSRAIIRDMVGREKSASMIGYVTMGMALAPMIGPVIGGFLDEYYGWQAPLWLLIFSGVIVFVIIWFDLGETRKTAAPNLTSQFANYPTLLSSRRFWGYSLSASFCSGAFFALLGGGPYVATQYYSLAPSQFGMYFAIIAVGYMAGNFISGRYSESFGITKMMIYGNIVVAAGIVIAIFLLIFVIKAPLSFFLPLIFLGIGNGMTLPNANAGIVSLHPRLAGAASGLGGFLQISIGALFSILAGFVLDAQSYPMPLLMLMLVVTLLGICATLYVVYIDNLERRQKPA